MSRRPRRQTVPWLWLIAAFAFWLYAPLFAFLLFIAWLLIHGRK